MDSDELFLEYPQRCKPKRRVTDSDQQDPKRCKYHLPKNIHRNASDKEEKRKRCRQFEGGKNRVMKREDNNLKRYESCLFITVDSNNQSRDYEPCSPSSCSWFGGFWNWFRSDPSTSELSFSELQVWLESEWRGNWSCPPTPSVLLI
jgi:hypothetical protein